MLPGEFAQLVLTDEPYNVANVGHVTGNADHRAFAFAHGEMSRDEFARFNRQWMEAVLAASSTAACSPPSSTGARSTS